MRILHLSDTHGTRHQLSGLPEADIIVHSGDITCGGSENEVNEQYRLQNKPFVFDVG